MARVIQVIDCDSDGFKVRLDDGRVILMPHGGEHPHVGQEIAEPKQSEPEPFAAPIDEGKAPTVEQLNSEAQAQAVAISEAVKQDEPKE